MRMNADQRTGVGFIRQCPKHANSAKGPAFVALDDALRWSLRQDPRPEPVDAVIHDEYNQDVLFRAQDGSLLVFDST
jgi:hypothetical protein